MTFLDKNKRYNGKPYDKAVTIVKTCGCEEVVRQHGYLTYSYTKLCLDHKKQAKEAEERRKEQAKKDLADRFRSSYTEELKCSNCGRKMGWVYPNDLEGTSFFCGYCIE